MRNIWPNKQLDISADGLLIGLLLVTLTAGYVLVLYALVVAVAILPFGDPREIHAPGWLLPLLGYANLLDAFLTIVFGPGIGIMVMATAIVLLTTPRVYRWLRIGVNELVYGQHDDAFAMMETFRTQLENMNAPQAILPTITATIAQTLKLPFVEIMATDANEPLTATFGQPPAEVEVVQVPLLYQDTPIGELRVSPRRADEVLTSSDRQVLRDLARQVGITLYAAQLTTDLQQSRVRLVTAREEERRRIRRDLHDGLGPTLANIAMRLEQAHDSLPPNAEKSAALLSCLTTEAQQVIHDIRRLVYQLRPPDLDEYGLLSALREYLHRMQPSGTTITLDAPVTLPPLPAAVEVAVYRIVQEAVNNAIKHAQASTIMVRLAIQEVGGVPLTLQVDIRDDGRGLLTDAISGIGFHSMRERAEEVGGNCTIDNQEKGGVYVRTQLPIQKREFDE